MVLQEDLLLRVGLARVMARPDQEDLALAGTYNLAEETARVGNPMLDPFEANTFDISLEWYLNDAGMLQGGFFYKDIDSFISNGQIEGGVPVDIGDGEIVVFDATGPINGDGGTVQGFEARLPAGVQLPAWLLGWFRHADQLHLYRQRCQHPLLRRWHHL